MSSRGERAFTLLEVLAGVLVLGLLYTVLANVAMRGLRSEGTDRRRAEAALLADEKLASLETEIAAGVPLRTGVTEEEAEPFTIAVAVEPEDVEALFPAPLLEDLARTADRGGPSPVLVDARGESRIRRVTVSVEWDEAGEPDHVERTTYAFDTTGLEELFPAEEETPTEANQPTAPDPDKSQDPPPELEDLFKPPGPDDEQ